MIRTSKCSQVSTSTLNLINRLLNAFKVHSEAWMITEYSGERDLSNYLENRHRGMCEVECRFLITQLLN
jgi:serine/threonine protein kinase